LENPYLYKAPKHKDLSVSRKMASLAIMQ